MGASVDVSLNERSRHIPACRWRETRADSLSFGFLPMSLTDDFVCAGVQSTLAGSHRETSRGQEAITITTLRITHMISIQKTCLGFGCSADSLNNSRLPLRRPINQSQLVLPNPKRRVGQLSQGRLGTSTIGQVSRKTSIRLSLSLSFIIPLNLPRSRTRCVRANVKLEENNSIKNEKGD